MLKALSHGTFGLKNDVFELAMTIWSVWADAVP